MQKPVTQMIIEGKKVGEFHPTFFVADIAANHDGDLERAKDLVYLAKDRGADAAKFQHFKAETIVSDLGFRSLGSKFSHQAKWKKSVFEIYKNASLDLDWTPALKETCEKAGITFMTSPYAFDLVDHVDPYVPAFKIGSGDITWIELIKHIASKGKPYFLATGASTMTDVQRAVDAALTVNPQLALMQCNTNYSGNLDNFRHIQLNVLRTYRLMYPEIVLGLSDHTPGHACVLGAVALGARIVEKHFTDDPDRTGPDHGFSMDPDTWREMVDRTRELEFALGNEIKKVEENEVQTVILQRRAFYTRVDLSAGHVLTPNDLELLRPCPTDGFAPYQLSGVLGRTLCRSKKKGEYLTTIDLE